MVESAIDGAFALLTVIADPTKAKARLGELAEANKALVEREAAIAEREAAVGKMKTEVVELNRSLGAVRVATESGRQKWEKEAAALETARVEFAARCDKVEVGQREKDSALREREREVAARQAKMAAQEKALVDRGRQLEAEAAALDTREAKVRDMEEAMAARHARIAEALSV